jgi:hypothetical protein
MVVCLNEGVLATTKYAALAPSPGPGPLAAATTQAHAKGHSEFICGKLPDSMPHLCSVCRDAFLDEHHKGWTQIRAHDWPFPKYEFAAFAS